jgi:chemotaxis protein methyltransferase CheR
MGPEAYTLAILLAGRLGPFAFRNLRIDATDIDETGQFGDQVHQAVYPGTDLERMPPGVLEQYFEPAGEAGCCRVAGRIRASVRFQRHDLLSLREIDSGFSLVVCKNVLLHFSHAQRVEVIRMFHRALGPGGYFVTEHTQKLPPETAALFEQAVPHGQLFRKLEDQPCA